ncbi:hypothetical protein E2C01_086191 [Portunus trituberculatus]|uniref:Uncharacterized protein n=1 Tax=Portunus trituberculatus TaxID=210409 RepID=A0A5B7J4T1_PORTR|nr:hypothetical protein [Portunus trituberculatus]
MPPLPLYIRLGLGPVLLQHPP